MIVNSIPFLYADDTVLVSHDSDIFEAYSKLQGDLDCVAYWCKGNKLSINLKKTRV